VADTSGTRIRSSGIRNAGTRVDRAGRWQPLPIKRSFDKLAA
jgi:hypothetical protein